MSHAAMLISLTVVLVALSSCAAQSQGLRLAAEGEAAVVVMLPKQPTPRERAAACELTDHLEQMCGVRLPVVDPAGIELPPADLLVNGDFELDPRIGWIGDGLVDAMEWARGEGVDGSHAARLKDAKGGSGRYMTCRWRFAVRPGTRYDLSAEIAKKVASGTGQVGVRWRNADGKTLRTDSVFFKAGDHDWRRYAKTVTAPEGVSQADLLISFAGAAGGEIRVDNLRFLPLASGEPKQHAIERAVVLGGAVDRSLLGDAKALGHDGFVIRTQGDRLHIAGATDHGTLNGVYSLLEEDLGVRWLAPGVTHIPRTADLRLPRVRRRFAPVFTSRQIYGVNAFDIDWVARQRLNSFIIPYRKWNILSDHRTSDGKYFAVSQCHTLHALLEAGAGKPLKEIFDEHPEYFPVLGGKRRFYPNMEQLCMSNPAVAELVARGVRTWAAQSPGAAYVSISQSDVGRICQCATCKALYEKYGYPGAGVARVFHEFVNDVAERVKDDLPEGMKIDTIAYHFTQPCPEGFKARDDVVIRFAPIRMSMFHAFDEGRYNTEGGFNLATPPTIMRASEQLPQWGKAASNLSVWYYTLVVPIFHPHPNLKSIGRNFRLMRDAGVNGIFVEHLSHVPGHELGHLKTYLYAKLTWKPDYDVEAGIREFCRLYYGDAAPFVERYIELMHDIDVWDWQGWDVWKKKRNCSCWGWFGDKPGENFYTPTMYIRYSEHPPLKRRFVVEGLKLFDEALAAVAGDAELERRVRVARIPVHFAGIEYLPKDDPLRAECVRAFFPEAHKAVEGDNKLPKWLEDYEKKIMGKAKE